MVERIYVEKKDGFNIAAKFALEDFREMLKISNIEDVRLFIRYDVEGLDPSEFERAVSTVFCEPPVDNYYLESLDLSGEIFAVEYLPGQYDQRADCCAQCLSLLTMKTDIDVRCATVYVLKGDIDQSDVQKIIDYVINPVDSRLASLNKPETLKLKLHPPEEIPVIHGFIDMDRDKLRELIDSLSLAMSLDDIAFLKEYFASNEKRDPTVTEIRVLDTYWSDHCRHTTFSTELKNIEFGGNLVSKKVEETFNEYLSSREFVYGKDTSKKITLMDIATIYPKEMRLRGNLKNLDVSDEINACTIKEKVLIDDTEEEYLILFKNETHNHPTEIEPFGGAATCLGGAIRDPLSGRAYVYQAMRVTGSADPTVPFESTLPYKLPQRKITTEAAHGYSSYGNQIGIATGGVFEIYHPGYAAKRMEIGAVIGAVNAKNVRRETPKNGDIILLIGGATGRDGCGGATGSSKAHDKSSIETCGAEVQKGNPVCERKLQRLFRNPEFTKLVKKCNDFGAGGVCVAIGELADGLDINLDLVPKKYEGLNSTELAISESQERMAVVVDKKDVIKAIGLANSENLTAVEVACVTNEARMRMTHNKRTVVDLSRELLSSNGAPQQADVKVTDTDISGMFCEQTKDTLFDTLSGLMSDINIADNRGLVERFDSTIGASSVLLPYGGKHFSTKSQVMAAKVPADRGQVKTKTVMSYGYDPYLSEISVFHGAVYAITSSVAKLISAGASLERIYLTLQEYFLRLNNDPARWGLPLGALLGAMYAQKKLKIAAIGGKDSMSGSFMDLHVPPTLVSFAVCATNGSIVSNELKKPNSKLMRLNLKTDDFGLPDFDDLNEKYNRLTSLIADNKVHSAYAVDRGGVAVAVAKMGFGNRIGAILFDRDISELSNKFYGSIVFETDEVIEGFEHIGDTIPEFVLKYRDETIDLETLQKLSEQPLEDVFRTKVKAPTEISEQSQCNVRSKANHVIKIAKPRVTLSVFPGTNCEYDTERAFEKFGAICTTSLIRNLTANDIDESVRELAANIKKSQIIMIPGGFSGGDEPDGSGKFIATVFRNKLVSDAVLDLLNNRDGLVLGICNGFQALIKLGLVPYGEIREPNENSPTLTFNTIGRHVSCMVNTKITSVFSPWLNLCDLGDIHSVAVSHGEGRFIAAADDIKELFKNGQVATRYVDLDGNPSMEIPFNPNGSMEAIEGILSPDGRVFGKMAHLERYTPGNYINAYGNFDQKIIESGVKYFL